MWDSIHIQKQKMLVPQMLRYKKMGKQQKIVEENQFTLFLTHGGFRHILIKSQILTES